MNLTDTLFVAGHRGMVRSAIVRRLQALGCTNTLTAGRDEPDLTDQHAVNAFFAAQCIDQAYLAAAKVGGIHANNSYPAEFIHQNLMIEANIIHAAHTHGVQKLMFLGSSCIYPKFAEQPMKEEALLTGLLEPTNEPYAIAKIAGIKLCESYNRQYGRDYRSAMPTNLYGPGDNYHPENSHVLPALIRRFHEAKAQGQPAVTVWGTGTPRREFLHVDDLADACFHLLGLADPPDWINVGVGEDVSILDLARLVAATVGYQGHTLTDPEKPDGTPRKLLDVTRIHATGWQARVPLAEGIAATYRDFVDGIAAGTIRL